MFERFPKPSLPLKIAPKTPKNCFADFFLIPAAHIALGSRALPARGKAHWWIASRLDIALQIRRLALSQWIPQAPSRAARS